MNERIRELAEQAEFSEKDLHIQGDNFQMFAELIVRECLKCSDSLSKHYIENHPEKEQVLLLASIADYSNEIRKHFGIKE
jgi:aspartate oxidase